MASSHLSRQLCEILESKPPSSGVSHESGVLPRFDKFQISHFICIRLINVCLIFGIMKKDPCWLAFWYWFLCVSEHYLVSGMGKIGRNQLYSQNFNTVEKHFSRLCFSSCEVIHVHYNFQLCQLCHRFTTGWHLFSKCQYTNKRKPVDASWSISNTRETISFPMIGSHRAGGKITSYFLRYMVHAPIKAHSLCFLQKKIHINY